MALISKNQLKKAEKMGIILTEEDGKVKVFWPEHNQVAYCEHGKEALTTAQKMIDDWVEPAELPNDFIERTESGVPTNGAIAFDEGITKDGNPFENEHMRAKWDSEWDERDAEENRGNNEDSNQERDDEMDGEEDEEKAGVGERSVVKQRYRVKYAEQGHPKNCGDWLAKVLENICGGKTHTDLALFEEICNLNGVSLAKYNRTTHGWQGRLRMTGRNILAKVVWKNKELRVPTNINSEGRLPVPGEWIGEQRFTGERPAPTATP